MSKIPLFEPCTANHVLDKTSERGWFFNQLVLIEGTFGAGRWDWWIARTMKDGRLGNHQIPQIEFIDSPQSKPAPRIGWDASMCELASTPGETFKLATDVFDRLMRDGTNVSCILDWFLYACGDNSVERPKHLSGEHEVFLYQEGMLMLSRMIANPTDWGQHIAGYIQGGGKQFTGWFPTPVCLSRLMVEATFNEPEKNDYRLKSVCDPCVGTGVMLLHASNYSLDLYGQDIDVVMLKWCRLNGYLFAPWMVAKWHKMLEEYENRPVEQSTDKSNTFRRRGKVYRVKRKKKVIAR